MCHSLVRLIDIPTHICLYSFGKHIVTHSLEVRGVFGRSLRS
jgi:hypothetical protein